jgi:type I restriction enzyme, S subunit
VTAWPSKPIDNLCELINGRAFKPSDWGATGLPIVRIQNLNDHSKPFNLYKGNFDKKHFIDNEAILLSWSGTPGTSFGCFRWMRGPAILNQHIFKVIVNEETIDGNFFIYAVNSKLDEMIRQSHGGVGLRHITKSKLEAIRLPVPQFSEQLRIVSRIKECIERVKEIEKLRTETVTEADYLTSSLYAALENGEKWPRMAVGDVIIKSCNGRSIRQDNDKANGFVLSLSAVHDVTLNVEQKKPIPLPSNIEKHYSIMKGDVFVSRSNTRELVGLSAVAADEPKDRLIYPDLLIKLAVKPNIVRPRFLAYVLRTPESRRQIKNRAVGTSQSMVKISGERLKEVEIPVPPLIVQEELIEKFDGLHDLASDLIGNLRAFNSGLLKQSILRKAFAGEL